MNTTPLLLITLLICFFHSFGQTASDSVFVRKIINSELKLRDKKIKKVYPVFQTATISENAIKKDSIYSEYYLGKQIDWLKFGISSKLAFYTNKSGIDSCLYIYSPLFNEKKDKFTILFEIRFEEKRISYFTKDYYIKKRKKWSFVTSDTFFSF